jgi:NAD(P)-dependent dehydrogenase (short-subunit alcohol dehydrogenase family)
MDVQLHDAVALVTGAAKGIGKAIAQTLAKNGARVVVADVDETVAKQTAAALPNAVAIRMDVSDEAGVEEAVRQIVSSLGRIDILVNNAGLNTQKRVNLNEFPTDQWDRIFNVDLRGLFFVSRAVSRVMINQGGGRIVNISSVLGIVPARLQCAFTAAKAGVINLTRSMAIELAPSGILVNCVAPGSTITEGTEKLFHGGEAAQSEQTKRLLAHIPLGRAGRTGEMAHAVLFFVAPESGYITGQTLCVDGGWSAGGFFRDF